MERRQARSEASIAELAEALKLTRGTRLEVAALLPAERKRHNEALARDGLEYLPDREGLEYTQRLLDTLPE